MEDNKDVKQEKTDVKKETEKKLAGETTKKTTTRKTATTATKKTPAKTTTKKATSGTTKKAVAGTAKKAATKKTTATTTKKVAEEPKVATKVEEKIEPTKVEKVENIKAEKTEPTKVEKVENIKAEKTEPVKKSEVKVETPKVAEVKKEETKTSEKPKFEPAVRIEKKKNKHPFLKTILVLIILAIILFLIHFVRNYIIVDSILARREALEDITNYSYRINQDGKGIEYYRKDNTIMLVNKDTKTIIWSNKDRKETIFIDMANLTATVQKGEDEGIFAREATGLVFTEKPHACDYAYWITSETVDGRDCYKITWLGLNQSAWYDKENGTVMKMAVNGEQLVTEYTNWKFNELTDEDMARPNLMGYEVTEVQKDNNQ